MINKKFLKKIYYIIDQNSVTHCEPIQLYKHLPEGGHGFPFGHFPKGGHGVSIIVFLALPPNPPPIPPPKAPTSGIFIESRKTGSGPKAVLAALATGPCFARALPIVLSTTVISLLRSTSFINCSSVTLIKVRLSFNASDSSLK